MSKFYVQCGPIEIVLAADSVDQAAMAVIDRALQPHLWIYDDGELSELERRDHLMIEALVHLDPEIRISERGFDRPDSVFIGTPETVERWHKLMTGINRMLVAAGLAPRAMGSADGTRTASSRVRRSRPR
jgi:hypothetical protein